MRQNVFGRIDGEGFCEVFRTCTMATTTNGERRAYFHDELVGRFRSVEDAKTVYGRHLYIKED